VRATRSRRRPSNRSRKLGDHEIGPCRARRCHELLPQRVRTERFRQAGSGRDRSRRCRRARGGALPSLAACLGRPPRSFREGRASGSGQAHRRPRDARRRTGFYRVRPRRTRGPRALSSGVPAIRSAAQSPSRAGAFTLAIAFTIAVSFTDSYSDALGDALSDGGAGSLETMRRGTAREPLLWASR
jgi:hypothetical protein